jgi:hypothetical protein
MSMTKRNALATNLVFVDFRERPNATSTSISTVLPMLIERRSFPLFRARWRKIPESPRLAELAKMAIGLGDPAKDLERHATCPDSGGLAD